ncbi:MAG: DnaA regulatory inactivator Hda [Pseudomonadales bacterium]
MAPRFSQFPLPLRFDESATFQSFYAGKNAQVISSLQQLAQSPQVVQNSWFYLHGAVASGVSHLLQASCHAAQSGGAQAIYLDMAEMPAQAVAAGELLASDLLEGMEAFDLLCLDNIEALVDDRNWQEALFYLLVKLQSLPGKRLLLGAHRPAASLQSLLPDLRSRLESAVSFALAVANDEDREAIIVLRARQLGCELGEDVARFIVQRYSRELPDLVAAIIKLDRQALSHARKLTLPFVKQVLAL